MKNNQKSKQQSKKQMNAIEFRNHITKFLNKHPNMAKDVCALYSIYQQMQALEKFKVQHMKEEEKNKQKNNDYKRQPPYDKGNDVLNIDKNKALHDYVIINAPHKDKGSKFRHIERKNKNFKILDEDGNEIVLNNSKENKYIKSHKEQQVGLPKLSQHINDIKRTDNQKILNDEDTIFQNPILKINKKNDKSRRSSSKTLIENHMLYQGRNAFPYTNAKLQSINTVNLPKVNNQNVDV